MLIVHYKFQRFKLSFSRRRERLHCLFFCTLKTGINCYHLPDFACGWTNGQAPAYMGKNRVKNTSLKHTCSMSQQTLHMCYFLGIAILISYFKCITTP